MDIESVDTKDNDGDGVGDGDGDNEDEDGCSSCSPKGRKQRFVNNE